MILENKIISRFRTSHLLKDSFWSVFGNGTGNFLLLLGGILIARFLGKDLYGEYGLVKTTMFYIAGFASFGLSYSSTKFIAEDIGSNRNTVNEIIYACIKISLSFSTILCVLLVLFSNAISDFVNEPRLAVPFRYLGVIVILRSLSNTLNGILGGFKLYKKVGINNIISGAVLFIFGASFTYLWGLIGSFLALSLSQAILCFLNVSVLYKKTSLYPKKTKDRTYEIISFSFPIAIQELFFVICNWGIMLVLTKYASLGDLGVYSAASQWYAVVLFLPNLLANVVLSYLSWYKKNTHNYDRLFNHLILINFICALIPFFIIFILSGLISSFYGEDFSELGKVLRVLIAGTTFACVASVYQADYLARNHNWLLAFIRLIRDSLILFILYYVLSHDSHDAALKLAIINTSVYFLYFIMLFFGDKVYKYCKVSFQ